MTSWREVKVASYFEAPAQAVFERISDHEGYERLLRGKVKAKLLVPGKPERNGRGAIREVILAGTRIVEEIVVYEPGRRMDYKIIGGTLPIRHELGRIELFSRGTGTELRWVTRFAVDLPLVGGVVGSVVRLLVAEGFVDLLASIKDEVETAAVA